MFVPELQFLFLIRYVATRLGLACLASSLAPDEGLAVFAELQRARQKPWISKNASSHNKADSFFLICYSLF